MEYSFSPWFWNIYYYYHDLNNPHFQILTLYLRIETHKLQIFPIFTSSEDSNLRNLQKLFPHAAVFFFPTCRGFFPHAEVFFRHAEVFIPHAEVFPTQVFIPHAEVFFPPSEVFFPHAEVFFPTCRGFYPTSRGFFPAELGFGENTQMTIQGKVCICQKVCKVQVNVQFFFFFSK